MQIKLASITVSDQTKALHLYTTLLGFTKQTDITNGPFRWLTVFSPDGVVGVELVLEPMGFAPAGIYQKTRFEAGIPFTAFFTRIAAEFQRLKSLGVRFRGSRNSITARFTGNHQGAYLNIGHD